MSQHITYINQSQWDAEVLGHEGPVVVDFFSEDCPPCDALAAKYEALAGLYGDDVKFVKIFRQENRDLALSLDIRSSPAVLFYRGGEEVGPRLFGGIRRAAIAAQLDAMIPPARAQAIHAAVDKRTTHCDLLILGAGPAGLTAAIYAAQARLKTIVVDRALAGGNVLLTHQVLNFPGFVEPQPGWQLAHAMREQAVVAGAELREAVDITSVDLRGRRVELDGWETIEGRKVLVATGSSPRPLGVPGEVEYMGQGISYCATCDAKGFVDREVVVIGGGNSAIEESLFITKFASKVTIVHQFDQLQANEAAQEKARAEPKIGFIMSHEPRVFAREADGRMRVEIEDLKTHQRRDLFSDGVFVFAGMKPNLAGLDPDFERDSWGYLVTDELMHTSIPDVFAAGDVVSKRYRQITTAVSDATIAAVTVARELDGHL